MVPIRALSVLCLCLHFVIMLMVCRENDMDVFYVTFSIFLMYGGGGGIMVLFSVAVGLCWYFLL